MKVLLLEDDVIFAEIIYDFLVGLNCITHVSYEGEDAEDILYTEKFDLLLLDINVPNRSGLDVLKNFREHGFKTPAIIITSFTNSDKIEDAYRIGCDDYIKKPFSLEELRVRIQYVKRIYNIENFEVIKIDKVFSFDTYNLHIIKGNKMIKLPKKEAEIVKYLLDNKNRLINISELVINIWEYDKEPSIATIRTYIKNIRKHFDNNFINTIKGLGYMFKVD